VTAVVNRDLTAEPKAPMRARELVKELQLSRDAEARVGLVLSELVTNAVVHGEETRAGRLRLALELADQRVRGEVCGASAMFAWEPTEPDLAEPGGLGLLIVDEVADRWGIKGNAHVCVWFECLDCASR